MPARASPQACRSPPCRIGGAVPWSARSRRRRHPPARRDQEDRLPPASIPRRPYQAPAFPVAVVLLIAPTVAVLQFRALALVVTLGLLACVVNHWRQRRVVPWPRGGGLAVAAIALALLGWLLVTAAWAEQPWRAAGTALRLGAFVLLGAAAAQAMVEERAEELRLLARCLV